MKKELYRFVEGSTIWTYTSSDEEETYDSGSGAELYTKRAIGRSEVESKTDLSKANLDVNFFIDDAVARRWMVDKVEAVVTLTIFEKDENGDIAVQWKGRMAGVKPKTTEITLTFESIFTSLRRPGLRARYLRTCRHSLYGRGCTLDKDDFAIAATATAASGLQVTVTEAASQPDGTYATGMIKAPDGTLRFITNHQGTTLTLVRPIGSLTTAIGLSGPQAVTIYPGCNRTRAICDSRFDNLPNYGGFDWIPLRNPFDGSSII